MQKTNLWLLEDKHGGRVNWEAGTNTCTLLYISESGSEVAQSCLTL